MMKTEKPNLRHCPNNTIGLFAIFNRQVTEQNLKVPYFSHNGSATLVRRNH